MRTRGSHISTVLVFCVRSPKNCPNGYRTAVPPPGGGPLCGFNGQSGAGSQRHKCRAGGAPQWQTNTQSMLYPVYICAAGCQGHFVRWGAAGGGAVIFNGKVRNYATQRTDTSVQATLMHCMDHKHSIHNAKAC